MEHFAYGAITPAFAFALSFLGCLLGVFVAARSRAFNGGGRARWLTLSAVAIGGAGTWVPHFMALLGTDVPNSVLRYDVPITALGFGIAVVVYCLGLYIVGFGRPSMWKILPAGIVTGLGLAAVYSTAPLAMRLAGTVGYDPATAIAAVVASVVGATVTLWCVSTVRGNKALVAAAGIMAVAACGTHYTVMAAVRIDAAPVTGEIQGASPLDLLIPVCVLACLLLSVLVYTTVGFSVRQNTASEEELLRRARDMYSIATLHRAPPPLAPVHRARKGTGAMPRSLS